MSTDGILPARVVQLSRLLRWPAEYASTLGQYLTDPAAVLTPDVAEALDAMAEAVDAFSKVTDLALFLRDVLAPDRDHQARIKAIVAGAGDGS